MTLPLETSGQKRESRGGGGHQASRHLEMLLCLLMALSTFCICHQTFTTKVTKSVNKERDTKQPSIKANGGHQAAFAIYGVSIVGRNTFPVQKT